MFVAPDGKILFELQEKNKAILAPIEWTEMEKCRENFRSFTTTTRPSSSRKVLLPKECAESVARRSSVGQEVALIRLESGFSSIEHIERIEIKRQGCDFLVIAFNCAGEKKEELIKESELRRYAALSAVDAVVDLRGLPKEEVIQLFSGHTFSIL